jgi:hypothetical protein
VDDPRWAFVRAFVRAFDGAFVRAFGTLRGEVTKGTETKGRERRRHALPLERMGSRANEIGLFTREAGWTS